MNTSAYDDTNHINISRLTESILWQGKIILKRNESHVISKYALIYDDRIVIRNKDEVNSPESLVIAKDDIISIDFPKVETSKALLTGYKGFIINYKENDKVKEISLWAKGLGQHPNPEKMKQLSRALETLYINISSSEDVLPITESITITAPMESIIEKEELPEPEHEANEDTTPVPATLKYSETTPTVQPEKPSLINKSSSKPKATERKIRSYIALAIFFFIVGFVCASTIAIVVVALGFI